MRFFWDSFGILERCFSRFFWDSFGILLRFFWDSFGILERWCETLQESWMILEGHLRHPQWLGFFENLTGFSDIPQHSYQRFFKIPHPPSPQSLRIQPPPSRVEQEGGTGGWNGRAEGGRANLIQCWYQPLLASYANEGLIETLYSSPFFYPLKRRNPPKLFISTSSSSSSSSSSAHSSSYSSSSRFSCLFFHASLDAAENLKESFISFSSSPVSHIHLNILRPLPSLPSLLPPPSRWKQTKKESVKYPSDFHG